MSKKSVLPKDHAAEYALQALAAALEAQPVDLEATAAGEKPLAATLKQFISAFLQVQSSERQIIENVARNARVRISAYERATPRRDPATQRFHTPLVKIESAGPHGLVSTLFLLGNGYIATWFGPSDIPAQGTPLRPLAVGVGDNSIHSSAINSLGGMLKEFIRIHKYDVAHSEKYQNAQAPAPKKTAAPVPAGAIQHDRHGDAVPDVPKAPGLMDVRGGRFVEPGSHPVQQKPVDVKPVPGLMGVRHGQLVEAKVATASEAPTTVGAYVTAKAEELGLDKSNIRYILGNLAVASINATAVANTRYQSLADNALQSLAKKIKKDKEADEKRKKTTEENRPSKRPYGTNDGALEDKKDPFTQEKLTTVYLLGDREVLLNEHSKVVYPIPDLKKVEGDDKA